MTIKTHTARISLIIFGFDRSAQLVIALGDTNGLTQEQSELLHRRVSEIIGLVRKTRSVCSVSFPISKGEVLTLAVPVTETEQFSDRSGLCVIYALYVSRRNKLPSDLLVQILASLELAIAVVCSGAYSNPVMTSNALTQLLQRHNDDATLESARQVADSLTQLYGYMAMSNRQALRKKIPLLSRRIEAEGLMDSSINLDPCYQICAQAARRPRASHRIQVCYYLPFSGHIIDRQLPSKPINLYKFLDNGIIVGHSFSKSIDTSYGE